MFVYFLRVRKKASATCHNNLWMYLMAQIPNLSLCPSSWLGTLGSDLPSPLALAPTMHFGDCYVLNSFRATSQINVVASSGVFPLLHLSKKVEID